MAFLHLIYYYFIIIFSWRFYLFEQFIPVLYIHECKEREINVYNIYRVYSCVLRS